MSANNQPLNQQLFEACLEALSLFDDYPEAYKSIGTFQVLNQAVNRGLTELDFESFNQQ
jgi:hypothetical protein